MRLHLGSDDVTRILLDAYSVLQAIDLKYSVCHSVLMLLELCLVTGRPLN